MTATVHDKEKRMDEIILDNAAIRREIAEMQIVIQDAIAHFEGGIIPGEHADILADLRSHHLQLQQSLNKAQGYHRKGFSMKQTFLDILAEDV